MDELKILEELKGLKDLFLDKDIFLKEMELQEFEHKIINIIRIEKLKNILQ